MSNRRREGSSRRTPDRRRRLATRVLIVCCGRTEKLYLDELRRAERNPAVAVRVISDVGSPTQIVRYAAKMFAENGEEFDAVWAVVDVDDFTDVPEAVALGGRRGVRVVVSNPCFELWLLLHVAEAPGYVSTPQVGKLLKKCCANYEKTRIHFPDFAGGIDAACDRAERLDPSGLQHTQNPSTNMWMLVGEMRLPVT